jgi:5-methylcytosine-specific restriction endonuclease McrA
MYPKHKKLTVGQKNRKRIQRQNVNIFLQQNEKCFYCEKKMSLTAEMEHHNRFTREHLIPQHVMRTSNWTDAEKRKKQKIVGACRECNKARGHTPIQDFCRDYLKQGIH